MATKRVLTGLRLDKIAAVGDPCQAPAIAAIIKRAPAKPKGAQALAKATFKEALEGNMIAGAVNEAFYQSFDGLWERNDAFRTALADEFAEGGDGTAASAAYVASVKALVDEAVAAARAAGATASDTTEIEKAFTTAAERWIKSRQQETKTVIIIKNKAELQAAIAKFDPTKTSVEDCGCITKAATDLGLESELPAAGPLAKVAAPDADLVRKVAILEMPTDVRKHFDGLDATAQTTFLAKTAEQRAADVAKLNETDPVVHKCADGLEIRKSDGATVLALAKGRDADQAEIAKLRAEGQGSAIEKKMALYPNLSKSVKEPLIKSALALTDAAEQEAVFASIAAMDKANAPAFKRFGNAGGGTVELDKSATDPESPQGRMDAIVKRKMEADPKLTKADAVVAVITDPEYQAAYNESLESVPPVAAAS
jgi:hypothetical protein